MGESPPFLYLYPGHMIACKQGITNNIINFMKHYFSSFDNSILVTFPLLASGFWQ